MGMDRNASSPLLEIDHLVAGYSDRSAPGGVHTVLSDVSLELPRGRTLGLVGESGCGKTTLGRAILGLIPVSGGRILYHPGDGSGTVELQKLPSSRFRSLRKRLQIIFQDPFSSLNPRLNVRDLLMEGVRIHFPGEDRVKRENRCIQALEKVGLDAKAMGRYPHEFSGGQRQRIGIARSIVLEPEFIVCDESVSALDVSVQAQIINLLIDIQDTTGVSLLFISHDISVVRHISHEIAVMDGGKIVERGESESVTKNPTSPVTRKLLDAVIELPGSVFG